MTKPEKPKRMPVIPRIVNFKIVSSRNNELSVVADSTSMGRQYDNGATKIVITRPEDGTFDNYNLVLKFMSGYSTVNDSVSLGTQNEYILSGEYTRYPQLHIQVEFRDDDYIIANTNKLMFSLSSSLPTDTEYSQVEELVNWAISTKVVQPVVYDGYLLFYNNYGEEISRVQLPKSIDEAPTDGKLYGRKNGMWVEVPATDHTHPNLDTLNQIDVPYTSKTQLELTRMKSDIYDTPVPNDPYYLDDLGNLKPALYINSNDIQFSEGVEYQFPFALSVEPESDVEVSVSVDNELIILSNNEFIILPSSYSEDRMLYIDCDKLPEGTITTSGVITLVTSSTDSRYNGLVEKVRVTVVQDDRQNDFFRFTQ